MNEVKIQIPDNCELIKNGDTYIVREKKQEPPRSWEEFCERYPVRMGECYISHKWEGTSIIDAAYSVDKHRKNTSWCTSMEEAEAFLALVQLRQLRKAWVGDWEPNTRDGFSVILYHINLHKIVVDTGNWSFNHSLTFPTTETAKDFLECFRDLCETAKILL